MSDVRRIAALVRPHAPALGLATILAGVLSGCRGALVWLVQRVFDSLQQGVQGRSVIVLPAAVILLFVVQGSARLGRTWITRRAALQAEARLRNRLFEHLLGRDPGELQQDGLGESLTRLGHDAGKVRTAVGAAVTIVQHPLSALAIAAAAIMIAPGLAIWAALGVPVVAVVITWTGSRTRRASESHLDRLGSMMARATDALRGLRTIQASAAEQDALEAFRADNEQQVDAALRTTLFRVAGPPATELAAAVGIAAVIAIGAGQVRAGDLTPGALVAFLVALGLLNEPLKGIAAASALWQEARGGLARVFEVLDRPSGAPDSPDAIAFRADGPVTLELTDVVVERSQERVLDRIGLRLEPGDRVVISGASGAGKSTLLDLIAGFVPARSGAVRWSGRDARELTLKSRRAHLALVDQEPWLGAGTIGDAIRLGAHDATDRQVADAATAAGLDLDLQLRVGDGGRGVSGGERQRIALARVLLRDAPILLLDEPTASLDAGSEDRFLETLRRLSSGRIVLLVSHRPGPLRIATRVYELAGGRLALRLGPGAEDRGGVPREAGPALAGTA